MKAVVLRTAAVAGVVAAVAGTAVHTKDTVRIEPSSGPHPELDPKSHKQFFDKDYPSDVAHRTSLDVDYPYPIVQTSATYDKDYTQDENNNKMDAAAWDAQLKHAKELSDAAAEVERLKARLDKEEAEAQSAEDKEDSERDQLAKVQAKADEAAGNAKKEAPASSDSGAVDGMSQKVTKEVSDLDDCKKQLEDAKARLAKLQEQANEAEAEQKKQEGIKLTAVEAEAAAEKKETEAAERAANEKKELQAAEQRHAEEKEKLNGMKDDLNKAEERLRNFRGGGATDAPAPAPEPPAPESGAPKSAVASVSAFGAIIAALMAQHA
eukprot:TRINITY_DN112918_c0_g1_i1.p1 TRINITY_DN112918_c0_g1~~TRINITY_DN112918_c0_g1_i1.p1  ORF type:complete len:323 (-),score=144.53 TRINITY_DN112918_c0_g1_i1:120-1088(-)